MKNIVYALKILFRITPILVVLLVIIVQLIQIGFMHWSKGTDKRIR